MLVVVTRVVGTNNPEVSSDKTARERKVLMSAHLGQECTEQLTLNLKRENLRSLSYLEITVEHLLVFKVYRIRSHFRLFDCCRNRP